MSLCRCITESRHPVKARCCSVTRTGAVLSSVTSGPGQCAQHPSGIHSFAGLIRSQLVFLAQALPPLRTCHCAPESWDHAAAVSSCRSPLRLFAGGQKKEAAEGEKPEGVRTHLRDMIIVPEMIGSVIGVYNGKVFNQIEIKVRLRASCLCLLGEGGTCVDLSCSGAWFVFAQCVLASARAGILIVCMCSACAWLLCAAGDDWPLPGRVLVDVQACEARSARYWSHSLVPFHPSQVDGMGLLGLGVVCGA